MTLQTRIATLPKRLRFAVCIWAAIALLTAAFPATAITNFGLLAKPWFWAGLLPLLAVLPFNRQLLPRRPTPDARQLRNRQESLRHTRAPLLKPLASPIAL